MELAVAEIDLKAVKHNLNIVKSLAPEAKVLAMIKADGYGHGALQMAQNLSAADALGVARIGEAIDLVEQGISQTIVLMEGCFDADEYHLAIQHGFECVIQNSQQLELFLKLSPNAPMKVWLKLDTGMHRLGLETEEFASAYQQLKACKHCAPDIVLMTHFACADEIEREMNSLQYQQFLQSVEGLNEPLSVANSATILTQPSRQHHWVRPGIVLYGSSSVVDSKPSNYALRPVMTFRSKVIAVKTINERETVGYGAIWRAQRTTRVAVVAAGYGDGYPRHAKCGTPVLINGVECPLIGRVSMDMITVDVTDLDDAESGNVKIGDDVELWGKNLSPEIVAKCADTISYTLFCGITRRVKKRYLA